MVGGGPYGGHVTITLRPLEEADLDQVFEWQRDPAGVAMAAYTRADPSDREAFVQHQRRIIGDPDCTVLAVEDDGVLVGTIGSFTRDGEREVTYWIDPSRWGQGIASAALQALLQIEPVRPLFGGTAEHNVGSARVLTGAGFVRFGSETSYAAGVGRDVVELRYRLDA